MWLFIPTSILSASVRASEDSISPSTLLSENVAKELSAWVMWRSKRMRRRFWQAAWLRTDYLQRLFGQTLQHSPAQRSEAVATWLSGAFLVAPFRKRASDKEPKTNGISSQMSSES